MRIAVTVNGADTELYENTFELNSRLSDRVSTAKFDIDGAERWGNLSLFPYVFPFLFDKGPALSCVSVVAIGGYIRPQIRQEVKINRGWAPFENCASGNFVALGGSATWIDHFFSGYISAIEHLLMGVRNVYRCTAQDYNSFLRSILVNETYVGKTEQEIIDDLFSTYWSDIDTTTYVTSTETLTLEFPRLLLVEALEQLAEISGREWYIDYEKKLHYFTPTTTEAPFELTDDWLEGLTSQIPYGGFRYREDAFKLVNKITVVYTGGTVTRNDATSQAEYGIFEDKYVDKNIDTAAWANLVGDAILAEKAFAKEWGVCSINQEGLVVGQKAKITNSLRRLAKYFLIQRLRLKLRGGLTEQVEIEFGDYQKKLVDLMIAVGQVQRKET